MSIIVELSAFVMPLVILVIIIYGIKSKRNVYDDFIEGAKGGLPTVIKVMPTLIGLMLGVGIVREAGVLSAIGNLLGNVTEKIGFPGELMPLTIVKMFSSSAATGMVIDIFKKHGPDSYYGKVTSLMMSSTETIFYTMSVYFMAAHIKKTRWTLSGALLASAAGIIASVILAKWI